MHYRLIIYLGLAFGTLLGIQSCSKDKPFVPYEPAGSYMLDVPKGFPVPDIPADNQLTEERIALGKMLFFDPILSRDSSIACGSCHFSEKAFSDTKIFSLGVEGREGFRNAPSLTNVAYGRHFQRDGGVPDLERQILVPVGDENEMDFSVPEAIERLKRHPLYPELFMAAYGREPDPFSLTRAIASFERTLISGNSPFDQYFHQGNESALTPAQKRGMEIFFGDKANCSSCHSGFNFTEDGIFNNGLKSDYSTDHGRMRITLDPADEGKFKVPTLRNIELTAPYMHDGSLSTLKEVVEHYISGGKPHPNKDGRIKPFELTGTEKDDLIAFLKSLTDNEFIRNVDHRGNN